MLRNSKLRDYYIKKIIQCFCIDIPANKTALLLSKNRNTINHWYGISRKMIPDHQIALKDKMIDKVEVDESYFGARGYHGKLKRGRGILKQPVFSAFERDGRVHRNSARL